MFKRDYTQEIGVPSPTPTIAWPYAVVILALVLAGLAWFSSAELRAYHRMHRAKPEVGLVATRPVHPPVARQVPAATAAKSARHRVS